MNEESKDSKVLLVQNPSETETEPYMAKPPLHQSNKNIDNMTSNSLSGLASQRILLNQKQESKASHLTNRTNRTKTETVNSKNSKVALSLDKYSGTQNTRKQEYKNSQYDLYSSQPKPISSSQKSSSGKMRSEQS